MTVQTLGSSITTNSQSASSVASKNLGGTFDDFLTLLTAQITNQDPLAPMDSTLFVTQLAQLSQVEQSVATNTNLEAIRNTLSMNTATADIGLIGKTVYAESNMIEKNGQDPVRFSFEMDGPAEKVDILIKDASGYTIKTMSYREPMMGDLVDATWDGTTDDGFMATDGSYNISIQATNSEDTSVTAHAFTGSRVKGISYETGQALLHLSNGTMIPSNLITSVLA
jgi:flagellar basal-body rod modification protein FlgD